MIIHNGNNNNIDNANNNKPKTKQDGLGAWRRPSCFDVGLARGARKTRAGPISATIAPKQ